MRPKARLNQACASDPKPSKLGLISSQFLSRILYNRSITKIRNDANGNDGDHLDALSVGKVFDDMGKLLFKAHLDVPLTFDRAQSQALLRRNNRLEFSYQQLKTSKIKLLNQLLATAGPVLFVGEVTATAGVDVRVWQPFKQIRNLTANARLIV